MDKRDGFIIAAEEKMEEDGVTRKMLAERCGLVEETINRVLEGTIPLKLETAAAIAAALGLSLDAICGIIRQKQ